MSQTRTTDLRKAAAVTPAPRSPAPLAIARVAEEWPQLWFSARQQEWASLVIVPAAADSAAALFVANALVESASLYSESAVHLVNGIGSGHTAAAEIVAELKLSTLRGETSIIAVDCPLTSHAAIHIARASDAAILLVPLGLARVDGARQALEMIGQERFLGSVTLKNGRMKRSKRTERL